MVKTLYQYNNNNNNNNKIIITLACECITSEQTYGPRKGKMGFSCRIIGR